VSIQELKDACDYLLIPFDASVIKCQNLRKYAHCLFSMTCFCCVIHYWRYVYISLVTVLRHPALSASLLSSSASVTTLRWEAVNIHV